MKIKRRKYKWLGHTLRKPHIETGHKSLEWNLKTQENGEDQKLHGAAQYLMILEN